MRSSRSDGASDQVRSSNIGAAEVLEIMLQASPLSVLAGRQRRYGGGGEVAGVKAPGSITRGPAVLTWVCTSQFEPLSYLVGPPGRRRSSASTTI